jgi:hypothetical protein
MSTKSTLLALALGVAAIAPMLTPAAAVPSMHLSNLSAMMPAAKTPIIGSKLSGSKIAKLPSAKGTGTAPGAGNKIGGNQIAKLLPQKLPQGTAPSGGIDNICPFNKFKCLPGGQKPAGGGVAGGPGGMGGGPVVIVDPAVPIEVPVVIGTTVVPGPAVAQTAPVIPHCTTGAIPQLAIMIDQLLPAAQLAQADLDKVTVLRATITDLAQAGNEQAARAVEEEAMNILGYGKVWLRCGQGTFLWEKLPPAAAAGLTQ